MKNKRFLSFVVIVCCVFATMLFVGCNNTYITSTKCVTKIELTGSAGQNDTYTITYSDGSTSTFVIRNGKDGQNGADGKDVSISDVYAQYIQEEGHEDVTYSEFLREYLSLSQSDNSRVINSCLRSCLKVYTEFYVNSTKINNFWQQQQVKDVSVMCGSAVIYKIESDYCYVLTNYHVVYNANANSDNGSNIARKIVGYLYGSDGSPVDSGTTENGYKVYDYGDYAIEFEYVGGSVSYDIAMLKVPTATILAINPDATAVTLANDYYVGQTAIAIGNPENEGISATEGIVSVDNEYIALQIDNKVRSYRSIRIDTAIYGGSSGGGLFNAQGELIGITNAGNNQDQNINYAIPLQIVKNVAKKILDNYDGTNVANVTKPLLGITVSSVNSKYVYYSELGYGHIEEDIVITNVSENSIAEELGLQVDDQIKSLSINNNYYILALITIK